MTTQVCITLELVDACGKKITKPFNVDPWCTFGHIKQKVREHHPDLAASNLSVSSLGTGLDDESSMGQLRGQAGQVMTIKVIASLSDGSLVEEDWGALPHGSSVQGDAATVPATWRLRPQHSHDIEPAISS